MLVTIPFLILQPQELAMIHLVVADYNKLASPHLLITNTEFMMNRELTDDGIYSPRIFGPANEPVAHICTCGRTTGAFKEGKICDHCGDPVTFQNLVNRVGWIDMSEKYAVIQPILFHQLVTLIGNRQLKNMLRCDTRVTKDGHPFGVDPDEEDEMDKPKRKRKKMTRAQVLQQWTGIGMTRFRENFANIVYYFAQINRRIPKKVSAYNVLLENWDKIWINKIPVCSPLLRPYNIQGENMWYDDVGRHYKSILKHVDQLKHRWQIMQQKDVDIRLMQVQINLNDLFDKTFERLGHKEGYVRREITGTRVNFVSRSVIIPGPATVRINELWLPYLAFVEMWQGYIIHMLSQIHKCDYRDALYRWNQAKLRVSPEVNSIIDDMLARGCYVLLNRNPTINVGSIVRMHVTRVKRSMEDLTTSIPNNILVMLGADYDGDTLNIFPLFEPWLVKATEHIDPRNLAFSRNLMGQFNKELIPQRDITIGLNVY
jgi:DNA-directed RNA polymerase beta' subunit